MTILDKSLWLWRLHRSIGEQFAVLGYPCPVSNLDAVATFYRSLREFTGKRLLLPVKVSTSMGQKFSGVLVANFTMENVDRVLKIINLPIFLLGKRVEHYRLWFVYVESQCIESGQELDILSPDQAPMLYGEIQRLKDKIQPDTREEKKKRLSEKIDKLQQELEKCIQKDSVLES